MSNAADRNRIRKRDEDEGNEGAAAGWEQLSAAERATYTAAAAAAIADPTANVDATDSAMATEPEVTNAAAAATASRSSSSDAEGAGGRDESAGGVQPLPEQLRKRPRRSPRLNSPLDLLAVVELQLAMQFLDTKSRLKMARCSGRLLHAASHSFAWKGAEAFVVEARSSADVKRIAASLLRYAPIHLRCIRMESFDMVAAVPQLHRLEMRASSEKAEATLTQLLQHPCVAQLHSLQLDYTSSQTLLWADTMRLIARLPQLRALSVWLPSEHAASVALLLPLADAPTLTDLSLSWRDGTASSAALLEPVARMGGLRRLSLSGLVEWSDGTFRSFFCSPAIRHLQHLKLERFLAVTLPSFGIQTPSAEDYEAALGALEQLHSLMLERVWGIDGLLLHLLHSQALRLVAIRCQPHQHTDAELHLHPSQPVVRELLAAAPQLEVRLLLPPTLDRWLALSPCMDPATRSTDEERWHRLHRMAGELDRVSIGYDESL